MSRRLYVGIDGGGGNTECRLADAQGRLIGLGRGGGANAAACGEEVVFQSLTAAVREAGLAEDDQVLYACLGLSGAIPDEDNPTLQALAHHVLPQARQILITNDAVNALAGALCLGPGICVNSGTGTFGVGRDVSGRLAFASGWGALLGDEGSGTWIGIRGLNAAARAFDGRGLATLLAERLAEALHVSNIKEAAILVYSHADDRRLVANLCPVVLACAAEGDPAASQIVTDAAWELVQTAWAVAWQLDLLKSPVEVARAGSVLLRGELLAHRFSEQMRQKMPLARVTSPRFPPAVGSLLLAFQADRVPLDPMLERLAESFPHPGATGESAEYLVP